MKRIISLLVVAILSFVMIPAHAFAAGISASGGGTKTAGQTFNISVVASGAEFNAFQGRISTTGPVSVVSVSAGSAQWMTQPSANGSFSGALLGQKVSSFTIATIRLKANSAGSGAVTVSDVVLKNGAATSGSSGGSASYTITKALSLPDGPTVTSATHPDPNVSYDATGVTVSWTKAGGVTGFSYAFDQVADTTPAAKSNSTDTTATFANNAIGTYYFHIRAENGDGWGGTTHFKINIKEPDAKINTSLSKPSGIKIEKADSFINNVKEGLVTGIKITGVTEPGYTANIILTPAITIPEGKAMSAKADASGNFELILDFPIRSGFYIIAIQGQKEKILTPISDEVRFEISQAKGGSINVLTDEDSKAPVNKLVDKVSSPFSNKSTITIGLIALAVVLVGAAIFIFIRKRKKREL